MKTNLKKELHQKKIEDLRKMLDDKRHELVTSRLSHTRGKLKNPRLLRTLSDEIAQLLTILRGKELDDEKNT